MTDVTMKECLTNTDCIVNVMINYDDNGEKDGFRIDAYSENNDEETDIQLFDDLQTIYKFVRSQSKAKIVIF